MAKNSMDEEALTIQRASRELEKLDDPLAQARVALYLHYRYTNAGDSIAPNAVALFHRRAAEARYGIVRQQPEVVYASGAPEPAREPATAPEESLPESSPESAEELPGEAAEEPSEAGAVASAVASAVAGAQQGWDLSGEGSRNDDETESEVEI